MMPKNLYKRKERPVSVALFLFSTSYLTVSNFNQTAFETNWQVFSHFFIHSVEVIRPYDELRRLAGKYAGY